MLELDNSWDCLHYLLYGESWGAEAQVSSRLSGGQELGSVDVGYGPARALLPAEVAELNAFLQNVNEPVLRPRCDPGQMEAAEIYRAVRSPEAFSHLSAYFQALRQFVAVAAENGEGLIGFIF